MIPLEAHDLRQLEMQAPLPFRLRQPERGGRRGPPVRAIIRGGGSGEAIMAEESALARGAVVLAHPARRPVLPPERSEGDRYNQYINSGAWLRKREEAFAHHGRRCGQCGTNCQLQVHHRSYVRLGAEQMGDLEILCDACHRAQHFGDRTQRVNWAFDPAVARATRDAPGGIE
jgi:hypothetical protein